MKRGAGVADAHGGQTEASNLPQGGARVSVRFPRRAGTRS